MSNELVINSTQSGGRIALLRDKNLVEFHQEDKDNNFTVGDIYWGTVKRVVPGLNAAFVDIGYEKDAFLHYLDLGPQITSLLKFAKIMRSGRRNGQSNEALGRLQNFKMEPEIDKHGKMSDVLKANQQIMVQVVKEPISTKGPRLSCQLSLAGRYLVLVPFSDSVHVSRKISDKNERKRLQRLITSIKPENFGVIVRTMSEGKDVAELDKDLTALVERWVEGTAKIAKVKTREKVIGEINRATSMLRDMLNESFDSITVDEEKTYQDIRDFIQEIAPGRERIVKLYHGRSKIFEAFGIEKQLKLLFGKTVSLPSGGYIIIEHTEALHVIDVNSGNKSATEDNQENTALKVNLEAASEVSRQLRLRDMGGIIVIDFIDMRRIEHKKQLYDHMRQEMKQDRSKYTILPLTKFGLMQITRQRVRPELNITTRENCPACNGTGKISASIGVADQVQHQIEFLLSKQNDQKIVLSVHPYLEAFFKQGLPSRQHRWFFKYLKWVRINKDSSLALNEYHFYDRNGQEIEVTPS
ncbi:MAG: ribonuclease E/G [Bernardetiaceae bacterium]